MIRKRWDPLAPFAAAAVVAAAAVLAAAAPAGAQTVRGELLDESTGGPVEGALVVLLDPAGAQVDGFLTNDQGRFLLRAPAPGDYTVRAERIGLRTVTSDPFQLSVGQIFGLRLQTGLSAIELEGIQVEGKQQCIVRPEEGLLVAQVWDEARKALAVQDWTEGARFFRYTLENYERTLDPDTHRILEERRSVREAVAESPVRSLPAEDLLTEGFIRSTEDGSYTYYGPDASVLLSDRFLDNHCFRMLADEDHPGLLGLAFEPAGSVHIRDIAGTLWLSASNSELDHLEYHYTWAPWPEARGLASGRVDFERMPNGAWIIRRWWIRMPNMVQGNRVRGAIGNPIRVESYQEVGGEVVRTARMDRKVISVAEKGVLTGVVWDSTRSAPLAGAEVYLSGTDHAGTTNQAGEFVLENLDEGIFTASFTHPRLDSLQLVPEGVEVRIAPGEPSSVRLAIPTMEHILTASCPEGVEPEREEDTGVVAGTVRNGDTGLPVSGATVLLQWRRYTSPGSGNIIGEHTWTEEATTGPGGRFTACHLPLNHLIISQASYLDQRSDTVHVRAREGGLTTVELVIGGGGGL